MIYNYEDTYLTKKIKDDTELQTLENSAIDEAMKLNITDELYKEQWVKARVYMDIAKRHLEAGDGMKDKYNIYQKELKRAYELSQNIKPNSISSITIVRG